MRSQSHNTLTGRIRKQVEPRVDGAFELGQFIRQHGLDMPKEFVVKLRAALGRDEQQPRDA